MVLTTHRMDEAESLCDNIAIMINGRFVCYGSPGHLKDTYGQGYTVIVKHEGDFDQSILENMPYLELQTKIGKEQVFETYFKVKPDVQLKDIGGLSAIFSQLC